MANRLTPAEQAAWLSASGTTVVETTDVMRALDELPAGVEHAVAVQSVSPQGDVSALSEVEVRRVLSRLAVPIGVSATGVGQAADGQIEITWAEVHEATGYSVQWALAGEDFGDRPILTGFTGARGVFLGVAGQSYRFRVRATGSVATHLPSDWSAEVGALAQNTKPAQVTGLVLSDGSGDGDITAAWSAAARADSYALRYRVQGTTEWTEVGVGTARAHTITGVLGSTYELQARAERDFAPNGDWSGVVSLRATARPLPAPAAPTLAAGDLDGEIDVTWTASTGASGYKWAYRAGTGAWTQATVTGTSASFTGTAGTTYEVRVLATKTHAADSAWSASASREARNLAPATPSSMRLATSTTVDRRIEVTWAAATRATGYTVRYRTGTGAWTEATTTSRSFAFLGAAGSSYAVQVKSTREHADDSAWHAEASITATNLATGKPGTPTLSNGDRDGEIDVTWTAVSGATGYTYRFRIGTGSYTTRQVVGNSASFTGTPGSTYEVSVKARTSGRPDSDWSDTASLQARNLSPSVPGNLAAVSSSTVGRRIVVSWSAVANAAGYTLRHRVGSGAWTEIDTGTSTSHNFDGVHGTTYEFQVRADARAFATDSAWSAGVSRRASNLTLATPANLTATASTTTSGRIALAWDAAASATAYRYRWRIGTGSWTEVSTGSSRAATFNGTAGSTYQFQVRAEASGFVDSAWSASVTRVAPSISRTMITLFRLARYVRRGNVAYADLTWNLPTGLDRSTAELQIQFRTQFSDGDLEGRWSDTPTLYASYSDFLSGRSLSLRRVPFFSARYFAARTQVFLNVGNAEPDLPRYRIGAQFRIRIVTPTVQNWVTSIVYPFQS